MSEPIAPDTPEADYSIKRGDTFTVAGVYQKRPWWAFWRKKPAPFTPQVFVVHMTVNGK